MSPPTPRRRKFSGRTSGANIQARFMGKFVKLFNGCWIWTAGVSSGGYGAFFKDGKQKGAHRVSFELFVGPIPEGFSVLHYCDTKSCVSPDHLFLGSQADNMKDMHQKGRAASQRGSCNGAAKLTEDQVLKIYNAPGIHADIAAEYGMHKSNVSMIKTGRNWGHVTNG